jgi:hypothetical protein
MEGGAAVASNQTSSLKHMTRKLVTTWSASTPLKKGSKHKTTTHFQCVAAETQCTTKSSQHSEVSMEGGATNWTSAAANKGTKSLHHLFKQLDTTYNCSNYLGGGATTSQPACCTAEYMLDVAALIPYFGYEKFKLDQCSSKRGNQIPPLCNEAV